MPGLPKEAILQYQINARDCDCILFLRDYKYYDADRKYRFYTEFCPHGDLENLRFRYRAAYAKCLREAFLWHVLNAPARAIRVMEEGPWPKFPSGETPAGRQYMLHMDLKPQNVFLGFEPEKSEAGNDSLQWVVDFSIQF